jgi:hypothetical protein
MDGKPSEINETQQEPVIIKDGLHSYPIPSFSELRRDVAFKESVPPSIESAQAKLDALLASIKKQGGTLIGAVNIDVVVPAGPGYSASSTKLESRPFLIIEK